MFCFLCQSFTPLPLFSFLSSSVDLPVMMHLHACMCVCVCAFLLVYATWAVKILLISKALTNFHCHYYYYCVCVCMRVCVHACVCVYVCVCVCVCVHQVWQFTTAQDGEEEEVKLKPGFILGPSTQLPPQKRVCHRWGLPALAVSLLVLIAVFLHLLPD